MPPPKKRRGRDFVSLRKEATRGGLLKKLKGRKDTDISSHIESIFLSSFTMVIPASFAASKAAVSDVIDTKEALMKLLKSFKVWDNELMSDNGVKHSTRMSADQCSRRLNKFARCKRRVDGDMTGEGEKFCNRL